MTQIFEFFTLLTFLFLLSKSLATHLGILIFRLTGNHDLTVRLLAFLFLPGTIVHEFAHAAFAQALGVPVGEIVLMPEIEKKHVKLGSVQIAATDPFRRFIIGVAPVVAGLLLIFLTLGIYDKFGQSFPLWAAVIVYYLIFEVGNSMFSSRRDMEGAIELGIAVALVAGILYFLGVKFSFVDAISAIAVRFGGLFETGSSALLKIVIVNGLTIFAAAFLNAVLKRRQY